VTGHDRVVRGIKDAINATSDRIDTVYESMSADRATLTTHVDRKLLRTQLKFLWHLEGHET